MLQFTKEAVKHMACPLCDGAIRPKFSKQTEDGLFDLVACRSCQFTFVNPTPSLDYIIDFYAASGHGERTHASAAEVFKAEAEDPNSTLDARRLVSTLARLQPGRSLLDVGCGYGLFSKAAMDAGFTVTTTEIADAERAIATEILGFEPHKFTFEAFPEDETYDAIIMSQILEHARDPDGWLRKVRALLKPGGVAAIALPNFDSIFTNVLGVADPYVTPPAHLNYFNANNLVAHAERIGFRVEKVETLSRIPRRSFNRRLGPLGAPAFGVFSAVCGVLDTVRKGTMLNVYLRA